MSSLRLAAHWHALHGPLVDGLVVGDTVRARASRLLQLADQAIRCALGPGSNRVWRVERRGDMVFVREHLPAVASRACSTGARLPESVSSWAAGRAFRRLLRGGYETGRVLTNTMCSTLHPPARDWIQAGARSGSPAAS